jgi:hypothetical protein
MAILTRGLIQLYRQLRARSYQDMARQATGWILRGSRMAKNTRKQQPIKLDFNVPRKHRLNWIQRTIHHRPR